jgi:hypothetical protein
MKRDGGLPEPRLVAPSNACPLPSRLQVENATIQLVLGGHYGTRTHDPLIKSQML